MQMQMSAPDSDGTRRLATHPRTVQMESLKPALFPTDMPCPAPAEFSRAPLRSGRKNAFVGVCFSDFALPKQQGKLRPGVFKVLHDCRYRLRRLPDQAPPITPRRKRPHRLQAEKIERVPRMKARLRHSRTIQLGTAGMRKWLRQACEALPPISSAACRFPFPAIQGRRTAKATRKIAAAQASQ